MGIRVTKETLKVQLEMTGQEDFLKLPYHKMIMNDEIPLSIGGGIGQSRTYMYLLRTAHLGEVSVTVWPKNSRTSAPRATSTSWSNAAADNRSGMASPPPGGSLFVCTRPVGLLQCR